MLFLSQLERIKIESFRFSSTRDKQMYGFGRANNTLQTSKDAQVKIPNQLMVSYAKALREAINKESKINKSVSDISID